MPFFEWTDDLDTKVSAMNDEHKELIKLMNRLYDLNKEGVAKSDLQQAFSDLANYTIKHFSDEEAYMESINYEKLVVHKRIHEELLKKVTEFKEKFDQPDGKLDDSFFNFLSMWLSSHIRGIDIQYGQ